TRFSKSACRSTISNKPFHSWNPASPVKSCFIPTAQINRRHESAGGIMSSATRPQLQYLHDAIEDLKSKHLYFNLKILEDEQKPVAIFDGKEVINLSSNNYLGLTTHPKLRRAAIDATREFGVGSGAVRTIAGTMKMH